jgi:hypothetical protein
MPAGFGIQCKFGAVNPSLFLSRSLSEKEKKHKKILKWGILAEVVALKGTGSRDRIQFIFTNLIILGLTKNLYWFLNFFHGSFLRGYIEEIILIGGFFTIITFMI